jgi:hypothetical protein
MFVQSIQSTGFLNTPWYGSVADYRTFLTFVDHDQTGGDDYQGMHMAG